MTLGAARGNGWLAAAACALACMAASGMANPATAVLAGLGVIAFANSMGRMPGWEAAALAASAAALATVACGLYRAGGASPATAALLAGALLLASPRSRWGWKAAAALAAGAAALELARFA